jgi:single-stranded DNA-binding protein
MNEVIQIGNLASTPQFPLILQKFNNGGVYCKFAIYINANSYTNARGERVQPPATKVQCIATDRTAETLVQYRSKGGLVAIQGEMQVRNYTDNNFTDSKGNPRPSTSTEIRCYRVDFLGPETVAKATTVAPSQAVSPAEAAPLPLELPAEPTPEADPIPAPVN